LSHQIFNRQFRGTSKFNPLYFVFFNQLFEIR